MKALLSWPVIEGVLRQLGVAVAAILTTYGYLEQDQEPLVTAVILGTGSLVWGIYSNIEKRRAMRAVAEIKQAIPDYDPKRDTVVNALVEKIERKEK